MLFYLLTTSLLLAYFLIKRHFEYWQRRNVPGPGFWYFAKSFLMVLFKRKSIGEVFTEIYRKYEGYPYVGIFAYGTPVLLVRDPDFVKHIVSTDFKSFNDNGAPVDKNVDPILGRNPFFLKGEKWRTTRSQLTPAFTSGKMWFYLLTTSLLLAYFLIKRHFEYWQRRNVPGPGFWYFAKSFLMVLFKRKSIGEVFTEIYRKYEGYPYVGIFAYGTPVLLVRDPDFVKHIVSTDFKSFNDNGAPVDKNVDPILGRNPFFLKGEKWRTTRSQLTPAFTSGKMKFVFPLMDQVGHDMVAYLKKNHEEVDVQNLCTRFAVESVATSAFGLQGKSFESDKPDFMQIALDFFGPESRSTFIFSLAFLTPWIFSICKLKIAPKQAEDKLIKIISDTIKYRNENNATRNDFLQYIIQLKDSVKNFTDMDAAGHAASFVFDGYDTTSLVITYLLYELARNQEAQDKLREEINEVLEKSDGKFTYETLEEMKYLEACMWESMRRNAITSAISKMCTQEFTYTTESEDFKKMSVTMKPGMTVFLAMEGLQTDPKYFDDPLEYRPERMLNKDSFNKYVLMPFGAGPRACLGKRLGMLQVKLAVAHVVKNFKIKLNDKTVVPLKCNPWLLFNYPNGIYLDCEKVGDI